MKEVINKIKEAYDSENIEEICLYSKYFAKMITVNIMENNYEDLKELCIESASLRQSLESKNISFKRDINYYMGYIYAYENIARKLSEDENNKIKIKQVIKEDSNVIKVITFLDKKNYASQEEIANYLNISTNNLSDFFKKESILESKLFGSNTIKSNNFYYLTNIGKNFYLSYCKKEDKKE